MDNMKDMILEAVEMNGIENVVMPLIALLSYSLSASLSNRRGSFFSSLLNTS